MGTNATPTLYLCTAPLPLPTHPFPDSRALPCACAHGAKTQAPCYCHNEACLNLEFRTNQLLTSHHDAIFHAPKRASKHEITEEGRHLKLGHARPERDARCCLHTAIEQAKAEYSTVCSTVKASSKANVERSDPASRRRSGRKWKARRYVQQS